MKVSGAGTVRVRPGCGFFSASARKNMHAIMPDLVSRPSDAGSGNKKYLSRIRVLHFLTGGVTSDVDIATARVEWAENITGLPGDGLCRRKLGLSRCRASWTWRGLASFGHGPGGRARAGARPHRLRRVLRGPWVTLRIRRSRRHRCARRRYVRGSCCCCRRRLGFAVDMPANKMGRRVENAERSHGDMVSCSTTTEHNDSEKEQSDPFHAIHLCVIWFCRQKNSERRPQTRRFALPSSTRRT